MSTTRTCRKCQTEILGQALGGLCPKCVAALALEANADAQEGAVGSVAVKEGSGDRIGRYKLVKEIGEGGCGIVYLAEQEEPVRRQVALKVIKLGMDTRQVIARFEAERQALALMNHPNIAKVHDAGATETGRPYFVMEWVNGLPITRYCDEKCLNTEQRLRLFVQVCQAIQHAHQKGIIHRDIKPTNILVTDQDLPSSGVPKIIDFGIAKATTDQRLTDKTLFTAFEQFMGTPAYMSPEQARLSPESSGDIDTRSDIYSLGVLLYELLTGKTPFEAKRLLGSGLDEIRRIIREEEPVRPSTRLQSLSSEEKDVVAKHRQADRPKLIPQVKGDLDWIVMKALEKDRARRYETANGLAMDVQRFLQDEPVMAVAPSAPYRLRKFVRRHRASTLAVGVVLMVLLAGMAGTLWGLQRALHQQREAQHQFAIVQQGMGFLIQMFSGIDQQSTVEQVLERAGPTVGDLFPNEPLGELQIRRTMGYIYENVGRADLALPYAEAELRLAQSVYGTKAVPDLYGAYRHVAHCLRSVGRNAEALANYEAAQEVLHRIWRNHDQQDVAAGLNEIGLCLDSLDRCEEGLLKHQVALAMQERMGDQMGRIESLIRMARCLNRLGRSTEALERAETGLAMSRRFFKQATLHEAFCLDQCASALKNLGRAAEALPKYEAAYEMTQGWYERDPNQEAERVDVAKELNHVAECLICLGRPADALPKAEAAFALCKQIHKGDDVNVIRGLETLADCLKDLGRPAEAVQKDREALGLIEKMSVNQPANALKTLRAQILRGLGDALADAGDAESARTSYQAGLQGVEAVFSPGSSSAQEIALRLSLRARLGLEGIDLVVLEVLPGGLAAQAGLRRGDVVSHYAGQKITALNQLNRLEGVREGQDLEIVIIRDGKPLTIKVGKGNLGARFEEESMAASSR